MAASATPKKQGRVPARATPTQLAMLQAVHRLTVKLGKAPSTEQLSVHLGYADHTGVIKPLRALKRLGLIVPIEVLVLRGYSLTAAGLKQLP